MSRLCRRCLQPRLIPFSRALSSPRVNVPFLRPTLTSALADRFPDVPVEIAEAPAGAPPSFHRTDIRSGNGPLNAYVDSWFGQYESTELPVSSVQPDRERRLREIIQSGPFCRRVTGSHNAHFLLSKDRLQVTVEKGQLGEVEKRLKEELRRLGDFTAVTRTGRPSEGGGLPAAITKEFLKSGLSRFERSGMNTYTLYGHRPTVEWAERALDAAANFAKRNFKTSLRKEGVFLTEEDFTVVSSLVEESEIRGVSMVPVNWMEVHMGVDQESQIAPIKDWLLSKCKSKYSEATVSDPDVLEILNKCFFDQKLELDNQVSEHVNIYEVPGDVHARRVVLRSSTGTVDELVERIKARSAALPFSPARTAYLQRVLQDPAVAKTLPADVKFLSSSRGILLYSPAGGDQLGEGVEKVRELMERVQEVVIPVHPPQLSAPLLLEKKRLAAEIGWVSHTMDRAHSSLILCHGNGTRVRLLESKLRRYLEDLETVDFAISSAASSLFNHRLLKGLEDYKLQVAPRYISAQKIPSPTAGKHMFRIYGDKTAVNAYVNQLYEQVRATAKNAVKRVVKVSAEDMETWRWHLILVKVDKLRKDGRNSVAFQFAGGLSGACDITVSGSPEEVSYVTNQIEQIIASPLEEIPDHKLRNSYDLESLGDAHIFGRFRFPKTLAAEVETRVEDEKRIQIFASHQSSADLAVNQIKEFYKRHVVSKRIRLNTRQIGLYENIGKQIQHYRYKLGVTIDRNGQEVHVRGPQYGVKRVSLNLAKYLGNLTSPDTHSVVIRGSDRDTVEWACRFLDRDNTFELERSRDMYGEFTISTSTGHEVTLDRFQAKLPALKLEKSTTPPLTTAGLELFKASKLKGRAGNELFNGILNPSLQEERVAVYYTENGELSVIGETAVDRVATKIVDFFNSIQAGYKVHIGMPSRGLRGIRNYARKLSDSPWNTAEPEGNLRVLDTLRQDSSLIVFGGTDPTEAAVKHLNGQVNLNQWTSFTICSEKSSIVKRLLKKNFVPLACTDFTDSFSTSSTVSVLSNPDTSVTVWARDEPNPVEFQAEIRKLLDSHDIGPYQIKTGYGRQQMTVTKL